jgi:hypothetical protein
MRKRLRTLKPSTNHKQIRLRAAFTSNLVNRCKYDAYMRSAAIVIICAKERIMSGRMLYMSQHGPVPSN